MIDEEILPLNSESKNYYNKINLLGYRKSIILWHILDNLYEIIVYLYLLPYYSVTFILYNFLFMTSIIKFNKLSLPFYILSAFTKFIMKIVFIIKINYVFNYILSPIAIIANCCSINLILQFFIIINYSISNDEIESILSGWSPRTINFKYY